MNFYINEFSILSPTEQKAFNESFSAKINLIVGEKDSGKSTLVRAMLYSLGCDVRNFDFISVMPHNIYILDFNIDDNNYIIIRKKLKDGKGKNYYKVVINKSLISYYYDTKSFTNFLNDIMNISLITLSKKNKEVKLYPNHIFLPFYTDQDNSWQNYLTSTFDGLNFIDNYRKLVLEYFTGVRSNKYYNLQLQKTKTKNELVELDALIKSKELIIDENNNNIKIIEDINVEKFKEQYKYVLGIYNNIIETEHKLKSELNEKIYKKNSITDMKKNLDSSLHEITQNEKEQHCPNCHQKIYKTMEDNYRLFSLEENLIKEREKIIFYIKEIEEEIKISMSNIDNIKQKGIDLSKKLDATSDMIELAERANSYALSQVNEKLLKDLDSLRIKRDKKAEQLKQLETGLRNLNKKDLSEEYNKKMMNAFHQLNIPFSYKSYYTSNLEAVKIGLSGATKVQAFIAQYLTIYEMITNCNDTMNIPMFIDTFLKDDFNKNDIVITATFIFNSLKDKEQSFVFVADNDQTLEALSDFEFKRIDLNAESKLFRNEYNNIYEKYENFLKGE